MTGIRVHNRKRPTLSRWLSMAQVAERLGLTGEEAARDARSLMLKAQVRAGTQIVWKRGTSNQSHWYTTEALIRRHAPELVDTDHEAIDAIRELRSSLLGRLEKIEERVQEVERQTARRLRKMSVQLARIGLTDTT